MSPGPVPKRKESLRRRNKEEVAVETVNLDELLKQTVEVPIPDRNWEPLVLAWYQSLKSSGQAIWYEPSDWMTAYLLAEVLDRWLKPQDIKVGERDVARSVETEDGDQEIIVAGKDYIFEQKIIAMPGATLNSVLKGMTALMTTEGERRRLRIELDRKKATDAALSSDGVVVSLAQAREDLFR